MASALSALANAAATFMVAGHGVITDPNTGNVEAPLEPVVVSLFLRAEQVEILRYPGVDQQEMIFDGYAVDPVELDPRVVVGTKGTLTFAGQQAVSCEVKLLGLPYGTAGLLGETLTAALGTKLQLVSRKQP